MIILFSIAVLFSILLKWDYYNVVVQVYINGQVVANFVEKIANFYDKDNKIMGTENTFTTPTIVPSNSAPFKSIIGSSDVSNIKLIINKDNRACDG